MTKTVSAAERQEAIQEAAGQTVSGLQTRVDALLDKIMKGEASDAEKHKASVLARILNDRKGRA